MIQTKKIQSETVENQVFENHLIQRYEVERIIIKSKSLGGEPFSLNLSVEESNEETIPIAMAWGYGSYKIFMKHLPSGSTIFFKETENGKTYKSFRELKDDNPNSYALLSVLRTNTAEENTFIIEYHIHQNESLPGERLSWLNDERTRNWFMPISIDVKRGNLPDIKLREEELENSLDGKIVGAFWNVQRKAKFDCIRHVLRSYYKEQCASPAGCVRVRDIENIKKWGKRAGSAQINESSLIDYWDKEYLLNNKTVKHGLMFKHDRSPSATFHKKMLGNSAIPKPILGSHGVNSESSNELFCG